MKRTALRRRTTPLRRNKPLNHVSKKKAAEKESWADVRDAKLAETSWCEAPVRLLAGFDLTDLSRLDSKRLTKAMRACTGTAVDVHHLRQRSLGGSNAPGNLLSCCRSCHQFAHENIALATKLGLLVPSWCGS